MTSFFTFYYVIQGLTHFTIQETTYPITLQLNLTDNILTIAHEIKFNLNPFSHNYILNYVIEG